MEALDGQFFERGAMIEQSIHAFSSKRARPTREFLQDLAIFGDKCHTQIGNLTAATELEAREVSAAERDERQSVVVYAQGFPVASEGELRDGVEAGEYCRDVPVNIGGGVER